MQSSSGIIFLLLSVLLFSIAAAMSPLQVSTTRMMKTQGSISVPVQPAADEKECVDCANTMVYAINVVLNAILQGELRTCDDVCDHFNNSVVLRDSCIGVCDLLGVKELVRLLNESDPDPIYICQLAKLCSEVSGGSVNITSLYVSPTSGVEGTVFQIFFNYDVLSPTSAGLISLSIVPPGQDPESSDIITNGQPIGSYSLELTFETQKHGMLNGTYGALAGVCASDCGNTHPYSGVYAVAEVFFNITKAPKA